MAMLLAGILDAGSLNTYNSWDAAGKPAKARRLKMKNLVIKEKSLPPAGGRPVIK